jgi:hypothetical protein
MLFHFRGASKMDQMRHMGVIKPENSTDAGAAPSGKSKTLSFGFVRDDGDLQLMATLDNLDDVLPEEDFIELASLVQSFLNARANQPVSAFAREDAPSYVEEKASGEFESQAVYLPSWDQEYSEQNNARKARRSSP